MISVRRGKGDGVVESLDTINGARGGDSNVIHIIFFPTAPLSPKAPSCSNPQPFPERGPGSQEALTGATHAGLSGQQGNRQQGRDPAQGLLCKCSFEAA